MIERGAVPSATEAARQGSCRQVAHDDANGNDLDLAHQLLAHVEPADEMRRDADLGELQHQELADAVIEDALAGDDAALLVIRRARLVLEMLDERAGLRTLEQDLGLAFVNLPASRHLGSAES